MNKVIRLLCFTLVFAVLALVSSLYSQSNPLSQKHLVIDADYYENTLHSVLIPNILSQPALGELNFELEPVSENTYKYIYRPGKNIEELSHAVIEYWRYEDGIVVPDYTTLIFHVTPSLIECGEDRYSVYNENILTDLEVLINDEASHGPLQIAEILYVNGGLAQTDGTTIDFVPDSEFIGDAFVYYAAQDSKGRIAPGKVKIKVLDPLEVEKFREINVVSHGGVPVEIDLPMEGFQVDGVVQNGSFENIQGVQYYVPSGNINASESFLLIKDNLIRKVNAKIEYKEKPNSWAIDDIVYTSKGTSVSFDVTSNDLKQNQEITSHSIELIPGQEDGVFSFNPSPYFTGRKNFEYTVFNGFKSETAEVIVKVDNFFPRTNYEYVFQALSNSALVIDYAIPIQDFSFEIIQQASNGIAFVNTGTSEITLGCAEVSGTNLVLYQPNFNFVGSDHFIVRYCVDDQCKEINISVNVIPNELNGCECFTGCVWAGDANNDGLVNSIDLLSVAYAIGTSGSQSEWNGTEGWIGRKTEDWVYESIGGINAKYADSDGNGIVDELDFDAILENYDKNHALVPPQLLDNKNYPFTLEPLEDTVYVGDLMEIEIGVGNETYSALDVHGLAFSIGLPPNLVDSSSLTLEYYNNSWLAIDNAVQGISKQITDGWIETALGRLNEHPSNGFGEIGRLSFIVEEDVVGGFRVGNDGIIPLTVKIENGLVVNGNGQLSNVKGAEAIVFINMNKPDPSNLHSLDVKTYPNPVREQLNIHLNGGAKISSYQLFNSLGNVMRSEKGINSSSTIINTSELVNGNYFLRINSDQGTVLKKVQVMK